ncbi:DUF6777 domain-containing protein [Streptomyces sp. NPDC058867]|uniref:DUF6777 domain-containing protein n=1 Tax=unclassified Streptomyces TaxID=2593676 RepID=UPI0036885D7D
MRTPTAILITVCAFALALLAVGFGRDGRDTRGARGATVSTDLFLQPVAARGPDAFTASTAVPAPAPPPVTRTQYTAGTGEPRSVSGSTPGLYGGTAHVGACDVHRQIAHLTADPERARAFAEAAGITREAVPDHVRGLTPVVLRADTRVSGHGYREGRATSHQSVLQAGTPVLVDDRGVPRLRCADGSPLKPPVAAQGSPAVRGSAWSGFRPADVVVVTAAPRPVTGITLLDTSDHSWIERRIGHDVRHDRTLPVPTVPEPPRSPAPPAEAPGTDLWTVSPADCPPAEPGVPSSTAPSTGTEEDAPSPADTADITDTVDTPDCAAADPATPPTAEARRPSTPAVPDPGTVPAVPDPGANTAVPDPGATVPDLPDASLDLDTPDAIGPESVPEVPDVPDGGGLIPDDPEAPAARVGG